MRWLGRSGDRRRRRAAFHEGRCHRDDFVQEPSAVDGRDRTLMAAQRERILSLARDAGLARVVFGHQARAQVDVGIVVHE